MIDVNLKLMNNNLVGKAVSKVVEKMVKSKTGLDSVIFGLNNCQIISTEDERVSVHIDADISISQKELLALILGKE